MKSSKLAVRIVTGFVKLTGMIPALLFFKYKLYFQNKKSQGRRLPSPCILVSNHKSLMDFALYLVVFPFRTIRFLMAEVLYNKGAFFGKFLSLLGGIKVDRDNYDFGFVGESLEVLDDNGTVGIFPEGRLPVNGVPWPFKPSVVYIALRTDAPIVPIYTDGNYGIFKRTHVMIGEKIYIKDYCREEEPSPEELDRLTKFLQEKIFALGDELNRAVNGSNGEKDVTAE